MASTNTHIFAIAWLKFQLDTAKRAWLNFWDLHHFLPLMFGQGLRISKDHAIYTLRF
jgi:hypothetical protein